MKREKQNMNSVCVYLCTCQHLCLFVSVVTLVQMDTNAHFALVMLVFTSSEALQTWHLFKAQQPGPPNMHRMCFIQFFPKHAFPLDFSRLVIRPIIFCMGFGTSSSKADSRSLTWMTANKVGSGLVFILFSADSFAWRTFRNEDHSISPFLDMTVWLKRIGKAISHLVHCQNHKI